MKYTIFLLLSLVSLLACSKKNNNSNLGSGKKPWDGRYMVTGTLVDHTEPAITYAGPQEYSIIPMSGNKNDILSKALNMNGHVILHGGSLSYYSKFGLHITLDPVTNKVTALENSYGQPSENGRTAELDPSGVNAFDPVTKTLRLKYWMNEAGVPAHRTSFDETWTYLGER